MALKTEYPYATIKQCMELAKAVDELGGSSSIEICAEKLGKQVSGAFRDIIYSAVKYGFVIAKRGSGIQITENYKNIKLSYNKTEKAQLIEEAFLKIPLFMKVCERFNNQKLPVEFFDKLLIKEFNVNEKHASKVKGLFIKGARDVGLMGTDNTLCYSKEPSNDNSNTNTDDDKEQQPLNNRSITAPSAKDVNRSTLSLATTNASVVVEWPKVITKEDYEDISDWIEILKRMIGRSVVTEIKNESPSPG